MVVEALSLRDRRQMNRSAQQAGAFIRDNLLDLLRNNRETQGLQGQQEIREEAERRLRQFQRQTGLSPLHLVLTALQCRDAARKYAADGRVEKSEADVAQNAYQIVSETFPIEEEGL